VASHGPVACVGCDGYRPRADSVLTKQSLVLSQPVSLATRYGLWVHLRRRVLDMVLVVTTRDGRAVVPAETMCFSR
jgi:hypothetical protein